MIEHGVYNEGKEEELLRSHLIPAFGYHCICVGRCFFVLHDHQHGSC